MVDNGWSLVVGVEVEVGAEVGRTWKNWKTSNTKTFPTPLIPQKHYKL